MTEQELIMESSGESSGEPSGEAPATELVASLRQALRQALSGPERARKALDGLSAEGALERLDALDRCLPGLRDASLAPFGLEVGRTELVERLEAIHAELKRRARLRVLGDLIGAAEAEGLDRPRQLSERPLEVYLRPFTARLDLDAGKAALYYARVPVVETELDVAGLLRARTEAQAKIQELAQPSAVFFDLARDAYRMVIIARGLRPGDRVDLVDLLAPLALLRLDAKRWRAAAAVDKLKPYPRYLFAYQLRRLLRERLQQKEGVRLELGTATGGSTRNKQNVLFVPTSETEGQYHLSIRFVPA